MGGVPMNQTDTLALRREKLIQKLRQRGVAEADLERRAEEMMAPIVEARVVVRARNQKIERRLRTRGWPKNKIGRALIELALRRGDRFVRNASRHRAEEWRR
jgi:SOS response regulatory protein OraA/RecX